MTEHDLARKAERALVAVSLSLVTLIVCAGFLAFR
jgi:hypothetical protein